MKGTGNSYWSYPPVWRSRFKIIPKSACEQWQNCQEMSVFFLLANGNSVCIYNPFKCLGHLKSRKGPNSHVNHRDVQVRGRWHSSHFNIDLVFGFAIPTEYPDFVYWTTRIRIRVAAAHLHVHYSLSSASYNLYSWLGVWVSTLVVIVGTIYSIQNLSWSSWNPVFWAGAQARV